MTDFGNINPKPEFRKMPIQRRKIVFLTSIPKANDCMYLGADASVATEVGFGQFLAKDHSLTAWFMPQFPYADCGAIFGTFGPGTYMAGQGDFHTGDFGGTTQGQPVLTIAAGNQRAIYLAPSWKAGSWHHVAVVCRAGTMSFYLDGIRLGPVSIVSSKNASGAVVVTSVPASEVKVGPATPNLPTGNLSLGSGRHPSRKAAAQSYGLLDDAALFNRALTDQELAGIVSAKRTSGEEPGLVAGWSFDSGPSLLPLTLRADRTTFSAVEDLRVSTDRNSAKDRVLLDHPAVLDAGLTTMRPPFGPGEVWRIVQGTNNPIGSHCGYAAFCWDLQRVDKATANATVRSYLSGEVHMYIRDAPVDPAINREANEVSIISPECILTYLHLDGDSLTDAVTGGEHTSAGEVKPWPGIMRPVVEGDKLAEVGPLANHLHLAAFVLYAGEGASFMGGRSETTAPVAFTGIEVRSRGIGEWSDPGIAYIPRDDDHIRVK